MLYTLKKKFESYDQKWRKSFEPWEPSANNLVSAQKHAFWIDHEFLRILYHNTAEVAPGVYRANQPSPERIKIWKKRGIKTIINLRGRSNQGSYFLEHHQASQLGIKVIDHSLYATKLPSAKELFQLEAIFKSVSYPILLHCKSGADRAGLASVLYHLLILETPFPVARKHLSIRYLHLKFSRSGILDYMLWAFWKEAQETGIDFRSWLETCYNPKILTSQFRG